MKDKFTTMFGQFNEGQPVTSPTQSQGKDKYGQNMERGKPDNFSDGIMSPTPTTQSEGEEHGTFSVAELRDKIKHCENCLWAAQQSAKGALEERDTLKLSNSKLAKALSAMTDAYSWFVKSTYVNSVSSDLIENAKEALSSLSNNTNKEGG